MNLFKLYGVDNPQDKKLMIKIYVGIVLIVFSTVVSVIISNTIEMKRKYENVGFSGIISRMVEDESHMKVFSGDKEIIFYHYHDKISNFLEVGDSIVKDSGKESITIYRNKGNSNAYKKIILNPENMNITTSSFESSEGDFKE